MRPQLPWPRRYVICQRLGVSRKQWPDGPVAQNQSEVATIVFDIFANVESAEAISADKLVARHRNWQPHANVGPLSLKCVPSKLGVRPCCSSIAAGGAPGPDGFIPDCIKLDPTIFTELLHPLLFKMATMREEPLMSKGTVAANLFKGSGSCLLMPKYRSISLVSTIHKLSPRFLRSGCLALASALLRETQLG